MRIQAIFLLVMLFAVCASAQTKRLYIAVDDHTDYMWTANEAKYDSAFVHMLDYYLQQIDSTKDHPSDFQARFNCDGSLWLRAYQKHRSLAQFNRLIAAIKSGHISAPLNMLVNCYGAQPTEAVIRGMLYAGALERQYNLRFTMAGAMENNTLPLGLASLWAGSGAKYSWKGIGGYGSQMSYEMREKRRHEVYRYTGLDSSSLLMKWYAYDEKKWPPLGGYAECRMKIKYTDLVGDLKKVVHTLDAYCDTVSPASTHRYNIGGAFGFGHDDLQTYVTAPFINTARETTTANRRVRVSNEEDYFRDMENTYPDLPSQAVSYGNEWDLLAASMNETTAKVRRATEKLRAAEALAAVVSLKDKNFLNDLTEARNRAWETYGMYWEHNWTADGPVSRKERADWQIKLQTGLTAYVDTLYNRSVKMLGAQISRGTTQTFFVFNPLSWARTDVADVVYSGPLPVSVTDATTGRDVLSQMIIKDGKQFLRIQAENIPSVGYKVYRVKPGMPSVKAAAATYADGFLSGSHYKLKMNGSGAITELLDVKSNRQLVKAVDGRYLNDLGGAGDGEMTVENSGPVSVTLKTVSKAPLPHIVRITVYAGSARIDIEDSIQANFSDLKTWSFSFNLNNPTTRYEELGAVLTAKKESRGGHYAADNARYDWQTFNHFADLSEGGFGVTLSNRDCSFFSLGRSTVDSLWETSPQLNALAGGNVDKKVEDGGILGILNQNGQKNFLYQFSLTTHQKRFDVVEAMKFALEHQTPLVTGMVTGTKSAFTVPSFSMLTLTDPAILLWSLKPAEDGLQKGLVTRIWNMNEREADSHLQFAKPVKTAWRTSHIETDEAVLKPVSGKLPVMLRPHQIRTYRVILDK